MIYYYDSNGKKYIGKIHICSICKRKKLVRIYKDRILLDTCKSCMYGKRKKDIKDNELYIEQKTKNRFYKLRAEYSKCLLCDREYLRRKGSIP